jgi:hypothetical protein
MKKSGFAIAFALGLIAIVWVATAVASSHLLVLVMTTVIGAVYVYGAQELRRFRADTEALTAALQTVTTEVHALPDWLAQLPSTLQDSVRQRIEGERRAWTGPALTPYLVGLLVMLGMLGTFIGMVVTLNGAVFALEGSTSVQSMRAAFSEPIKGLGLAFGTSVAGVASSAMLGLMSSLARRERAQAAHHLDLLIGTHFKAFSLAHQRQETFRALQQQTRLLPEVVEHLRTLMNQMERHSQGLSEQLQTQQARFHQEVKTAYTDLAQAVDSTLRGSLTQSMQLASDSIRPVVQATLSDMAQQSLVQHERMVDSTRSQLQALQTQFGQSAQSVADTWASALGQHQQASSALVQGLQQQLQQFGQQLDSRTQSLLAQLEQTWAQQHAQQSQADQQRLDGWQQQLQTVAETLREQWQSAGQATLERQQQMGEALAQAAQTITREVGQDVQRHAQESLGEISRLIASSEALVRARVASEAESAAQHQRLAQELSLSLRTELSALREQEAARADAAVAQLAELQNAVTRHLSTLGTALEQPIARLIETASEAPRAAAEVIGQLRQEISVSTARDNALLEERTRILDTLSTLLDAIHHASTEQRGVIDALVRSSQAALEHTRSGFAAEVQAQTERLGAMADQVTASAVDVASLGDTFGFAVRSFNDSNEKLITQLQGIEAAIGQSLSRSDEQLAYYVAQAREIIDLSISSQKDVLEALQQRQAQGAA